MHALRAEDECRQLLVRFPNSKFAPETQQMLRNIQEVLAEHEYRAGSFYHMKGSYPAAANRLQGLIDQYPLYSGADTTLWQLADSYVKMGDRFEDGAATAYTRIVRDYPLSQYADPARQKLIAMKRPVPETDPVSYARMKYDLEHRQEPGFMSHFWGMFRKSPDVSLAAKSGTPTMSTLRPGVPVSVPSTETTATGVSAEVSVSPVTDPTALDKNPDARQNPPAQAKPAEPAKQP
jgi:outer membrane protein assembly factor BamD